MPSVSQDAVFIGANRQNFVSDYLAQHKTVAYGAGTTIALWEPLSTTGVYHTLKQHTREVTAVKFIPNTDFLVTGGEDAVLCVWRRTGSSYSLVQATEHHQKSITCIAVCDGMFVTGGADGTVKTWALKDDQFEAVGLAEIALGLFPLSLALQRVDHHNYIVAIGGVTSSIYIYCLNWPDVDHVSVVQSAVLKGHEDWVKCLSFVTDVPHKSYILASGSQDRYIRLWRLNLNDYIDDSDEDERKLILLSNKQYKFAVGTGRGAFSFEALIMGHDDWVTGLQWNPSNKLQLLSTSADTALMIWEMDQESGIWCCVNRLGEMSIKGASTATGASGGFWSCLWLIEDSRHYILANGKTGSFRVYKSDDDAKTFESFLGISGPTREVTDIVWSQNGKYVLSTSLDQTSRLYAPWKADQTWHEFARPQIHGYNMICLDNINATKFVSGGDEKVLRVFEITHSITKLLDKLCDIQIVAREDVDQLPESAALPVLGLSNKAANEQLEAGEAAQQQQDAEENYVPTNDKDDIIEALSSPPLEDHLQRYTLFPEIEKLYGHGYEITCCATSPTGLIASACKSNSSKHAVIRVFDSANDFQQLPQVLEGHNLTITSLEFSRDGKYLLAVSRDRQFSLWSVNDKTFELVQLNTKAHARIIWDCSWAPAQLGHVFVTGSRDKLIKLWRVNQDSVDLVASTKLADPVTSISCLNSPVSGKLVVAVGTEAGDINLFSADLETSELQLVLEVSKEITPAGKVSKLAFSNEIGDKLLLGVASADTSVRVYSIAL
ncbi:WD40 repeat-like protein [Suhomyces tanzawaensis NRRL Y-17324]|uniref:Elongator complex protein 2 n=1 Tax=Suhomyces tanzawaensis NRRL Y-17324 TaxID=984487 RepID=A0A1E4SHN4_9ASCO|nr:WD40 repeat-like protein [Suhomyces tanzawaensis NRRL Y-17324]ODV78980.1 WD40 repeat-like protein [Suhomyces tanzawaensis NRRL Y-17324]